MTLHHTKHHHTYVNGLNAAEEQYTKLTAQSLGDVKEKIALQTALKFNGGGACSRPSDEIIRLNPPKAISTTVSSGRTWHPSPRAAGSFKTAR